MRTNSTIIRSLIAASCLLCLHANAQLSGVYSINSASVTSGTNFQSFTDLAQALNSSGISAPVTVNVVANSGPYNEQVNFTNISGTSATNTITINGNNNQLKYSASSSSQAWTLGMGGADYMFFNNLNVEGLGSYALVCHLWNQANNNEFNNCTFVCPVNSTSSNQIPVSLSGSSSSYYGSGNAGNNNTWTSCEMKWGWAGITFYTWTSSPYNTNNSIIDCDISDFYNYGLYNYYAKQTTLQGNTIGRPNRTNPSTAYAAYMYQTYGSTVYGNRIGHLYDGNPGTTNTTYALYLYGAASSASPNLVANNIVSIDKTNGTIYAMYLSSASYCHVYHNTISLDDDNAGGSGTIRGIYSTSGSNRIIKNNIISITHSGSGTKHCLYYTSSGVSSDNNVLYMNSPSGSNYTGYYSGNYSTLANWQTANGSTFDQASVDADPIFTNPGLGNVLPNSYAVNDIGTPVGITNDINNLVRSTTTPDPGAHEFLNTPCSGVPVANSVVTPTTLVCPNEETFIGLANTYTNSGITYQWQASTSSSVGPFTPIAGATLPFINTNTIVTTTYFTAVITCTNGNGNVTAVAGQVLIAPTITDVVPYHEGFEGITTVNRLPNCSWHSDELGSTALTYTTSNANGRVPHTGTNFASFYYNPANVNYFYTNGIWLNAGVTYSAGLWFQTEYYGYNNWSDLSILLGASQSSTGLVTIASTNGPAISNVYKALSDTFSVGTSGLYYIAVRGTGGTSSSAQYLSWDDLSITIPCQFNALSVAISAPTQTICSGQPLLLTATGAQSYTWNNGSSGSAINVNPLNLGNVVYSVTGSSTLSGCSATASNVIMVKPTPHIFIYADAPAVCSGKSVQLSAVGAVTYTWSTGGNNPVTIVTPVSNTSYSVMGSNSYGCVGLGGVQVTVNPLPQVTAFSNVTQICAGESAILTGGGGTSYEWTEDNGLTFIGNPLTVSPAGPYATYTVTGTDDNGCSSVAVVSMVIEACTGINELLGANLQVYPNPFSSQLNLMLDGATPSTINITDLTGREVASEVTGSGKVTLDLGNLASGFYLVKVKAQGQTSTIKVMKN
jgi:hypothetical protein